MEGEVSGQKGERRQERSRRTRQFGEEEEEGQPLASLPPLSSPRPRRRTRRTSTLHPLPPTAPTPLRPSPTRSKGNEHRRRGPPSPSSLHRLLPPHPLTHKPTSRASSENRQPNPSLLLLPAPTTTPLDSTEVELDPSPLPHPLRLNKNNSSDQQLLDPLLNVTSVLNLSHPPKLNPKPRRERDPNPYHPHLPPSSAPRSEINRNRSCRSTSSSTRDRWETVELGGRRCRRRTLSTALGEEEEQRESGSLLLDLLVSSSLFSVLSCISFVRSSLLFALASSDLLAFSLSAIVLVSSRFCFVSHPIPSLPMFAHSPSHPT